MTMILTCVFVYLLWGLLIGIVSVRVNKYPWWVSVISMFVWFPVAMGMEVKIGKVKIIRDDEHEW